MRTRLAVLASLMLLLPACTGGGDEGSGATPAELEKRLSAARATIDEAETVDISLATKQLPQGVSGLLSAKGQGNHTPAFQGDVVVVTGGASLEAEVVALEGTVYAKTSFAPTFLSIDPKTLQAPDPAGLLDAEDGITQILEQTEGLEEKGESRDGEDVLTTITGTLPGDVVQAIIPSADAASDFPVTYRLTDDDTLADATMKGPFYPGGKDVTYVVKLTTSDEPVSIEKPARAAS